MSSSTSSHSPSALRGLGSALARLLAGILSALALKLRGRAAAHDAPMQASGRGDGPPDLDELWRDLNNKLGGLFGGKGKPQRGNGSDDSGGDRGGGGGGGPSFTSDPKSAGIGALLIVGVVLMVWLGSGFFIVQEGEQAVVTSFGKYSRTEDAGFKWRLPYPFQAHEGVRVTQLRSREVGKNAVVPATGLRDSSMLTQDENIIDIRFTVQYRLKDSRAFLFENRDPEDAVGLAAESAVREIVGKSKIDSVLYEQRDAIAADLVTSIQNQLDRLKAGIVVVNVNVQSVQPPEQVLAAFEDTLKAGQDGDRLKKEGQAYASDVIPKAQGSSARLREEAEGYKSRVIAQAEGDAQRFRQVLAEYQKAPGVTRDRLYLETMQQVYSNVSKVMIDSHSNSNLLYLPLEKLMQQAGAVAPAIAAPAAPAAEAGSGSVDVRSRDGQRGRDRDGR